MSKLKEMFSKRSEPDNKSVFAAYVLQVQRKVANELNLRVRKWSATQVKVAFICFCLLAGGYCCYIVVKAVVFGNGPPITKAINGVMKQQPDNTKHK